MVRDIADQNENGIGDFLLYYGGDSGLHFFRWFLISLRFRRMVEFPSNPFAISAGTALLTPRCPSADLALS
jgi:hypothetical protein